MKCLCCGKQLECVHPTEAPNQPSDGIIAYSCGNFGSGVFDSIYGEEQLVFYVCDECLRARKSRMFVYVKGFDVPEPAELHIE